MDCDKLFKCNNIEAGNSLAECLLILIVILIFYVVLAIVLLIIFCIGAAGKHYVRVFSSIVLFVLDLVIAILSLLIIIKEVEIYAFLILALSLFTAIFNLASIILPNCDCCFFLSYERELQDKTENKNSVYSPPQNTNNVNIGQEQNIQLKEYSAEEHPEKPYYYYENSV